MVLYNHALLYLFAVSTGEVYGKIISADLIARITASGISWVLSANHWLGCWYPLGWICLAIHFLLFNITISRLHGVET